MEDINLTSRDFAGSALPRFRKGRQEPPARRGNDIDWANGEVVERDGEGSKNVHRPKDLLTRWAVRLNDNREVPIEVRREEAEKIGSQKEGHVTVRNEVTPGDGRRVPDGNGGGCGESRHDDEESDRPIAQRIIGGQRIPTGSPFRDDD